METLYYLISEFHLLKSAVSVVKENNRLQSKCNILLNLKRCLRNGVPVEEWPNRLSRFKRYVSGLECNGGVVTHSNIIVVPFRILVQITLALHYQFAHVGRDKLIGLVRNLIWHPSTYKVASDVTRTCKECQLLKTFSTVMVPPTLKIVTSRPFELIAMDLIKLPLTSAGYIGCLVVVDHHSKWLACTPIKDQTSKTVVRMLNDYVFPFMIGTPGSVLTDNGKEFDSHDFTQFLESMNITHKSIVPMMPKCNGAVERVNRTVLGFLRSLTEQHSDWDKHLCRALLVYNTTIHAELGVSPSEFLLSRSHSVNYSQNYGNINSTWKVGHPNFMPFSIDQLVLKRNDLKGHLTTNKLEPRYFGPYCVTKVNQSGITYELCDRATGRSLRAHHSQLRIFNEPPNYIVRNYYYVQNVASKGNVDVVDFSEVPISDDVQPLVGGVTGIGYSSGTSSRTESISETSSSSDFDESSSSFSGFSTVSSVDVGSNCSDESSFSGFLAPVNENSGFDPSSIAFPSNGNLSPNANDDNCRKPCACCTFESSRSLSSANQSVFSVDYANSVLSPGDLPLQSTRILPVIDGVSLNLPIEDDWEFSSVDYVLDQTDDVDFEAVMDENILLPDNDVVEGVISEEHTAAGRSIQISNESIQYRGIHFSE